MKLASVLVGIFMTMSLVLGCGRTNVGVTSQNDYAYAAEKPQQAAKARAKFDSTLQYLESTGLRATSVNHSEKRSEATLESEGTRARLVLTFPENGFAIINFSFKHEGTSLKSKSEQVLERAQLLLAPEQSSPK